MASPSASIQANASPIAPSSIATTPSAAWKSARVPFRAGGRTSTSSACGRSGTTPQATIDTTTTGWDHSRTAVTDSAHSWYTWEPTVRVGARIFRACACRRGNSGVSSWSARGMASQSRRASRSSRLREMRFSGRIYDPTARGIRRRGTLRSR